jgi:hypothetical protein
MQHAEKHEFEVQKYHVVHRPTKARFWTAPGTIAISGFTRGDEMLGYDIDQLRSVAQRLLYEARGGD